MAAQPARQRTGEWVGVKRYLLRHVVASAVMVLCLELALLIAFLCLFLGHTRLDRELVGDAGTVALLFLFGPIIAVPAVLLPVTTACEVWCRRSFASRKWIRIPLAVILLFIETVGFGALYVSYQGEQARSGARQGVVVALIMIIPLVIYWVSLQSTDRLLGIVGVCRQRLGEKSPKQNPP